MIRALLLNTLLLSIVLCAIDKDIMTSVPVILPSHRDTQLISSSEFGPAISTLPAALANCTTSSLSPPTTTALTPQSLFGSTEALAALPSSVIHS
jgi:hypothetical protein